jgi:acyl-CoA synthetase (AMP-forming)/AMP-acid ligase II
VLPEIVRQAAERFGDRSALVAGGRPVASYVDLDRSSDEVATGLLERGVEEGDVVALVLPSDVDYVVTYLAAAKIGAVTAGVNPRLTPAEREALLEVAQPTIVVDRDDVSALRRPGSPPPPVLPPDPDRLVAIVFTSGTTGVPRGAVFANRQLDAIARSDVPGWDDPHQWGGGGPMLASTQFAHVGFMTKLAWYLRTGSTVHLLDRWRPAEVLRVIASTRMRGIGGVAPQLALLLREPTFDQHDFSAVQTIVMGGALSPPALVTEARERFGAAYSIRYSSTESGGVGTGTAFDADDEEALFTVGRPRGDVVVEIRDDDDRHVADGDVGEICLRSSCVMSGYWRDPRATAEVLRDGWLHTGDLGYLDDRGLLRLAGRRKEMFVRGGYNVYPVEVESVLASHPDIADVAVVPRPDEVMGETGVAVIVPRHRHQPPTLDELRAFAAQRLAAHKLPEALRVVDHMPLTAMQKVDRRSLAAEVADTVE